MEPRTRGMFRARQALACVLLAATACGGSGEGGDGEAAPTSPSAATTVTLSSVVSTTLALTERLGGQDAFAASVIALDRGYSLPQLLEQSDGLDPQGWIVVDGAPVLPAGPSLGLVGPTPSGDGTPRQPHDADRARAGEHSEREEYVAFIGSTLGEIWMRVDGRVKSELPGAEVDAIVDGIIDDFERRRIDAEFDAIPTELDSLAENEAWAATLTLLLVGQGYSLEDAVEAALLGTFANAGPCLYIPGAAPATALRTDGCEAVIDEAAAAAGPSDSATDPGDPAAPTTSSAGAEAVAWAAPYDWSAGRSDYDVEGTGSVKVTAVDDRFVLNYLEEAVYVWHRHDGDCTSSSTESGELWSTGPPDQHGWIVFEGPATTQGRSDCPFDAENGTTTRTVRGRVDGDTFVLSRFSRGTDLVLTSAAA